MKTYKEIKSNHDKVKVLGEILSAGEHPDFYKPNNEKILEKLQVVSLYHIERGYETLNFLQQEKKTSSRNQKRKIRSKIRNISHYIESLQILSSNYEK